MTYNFAAGAGPTLVATTGSSSMRILRNAVMAHSCLLGLVSEAFVLTLWSVPNTQAPCHGSADSCFLRDYNCLAAPLGPRSATAGLPKYIFPIHLPWPRKETSRYFKLLRCTGAE